MNPPQEFLVQVAADRKIGGTELLSALLGLTRLPAEVRAITFGDAENAPQVYEEALRRFAERRGYKLVEEVPA